MKAALTGAAFFMHDCNLIREIRVLIHGIPRTSDKENCVIFCRILFKIIE